MLLVSLKSLPGYQQLSWLLVAAVLILASGASAGKLSAPSQEPIVARVDEEPIYASEVERFLRPAPPRIGTAPPAEPRREALHRALRVRLFANEARRRGIKALAGPPALVEAHLVQGLIRQELQTHGIQTDAIADGEARRYFEQHRGSLSRVKSIRVSAIVLAGPEAGVRAEQLFSAAARASEEGFLDLVRQHSMDESSKTGSGHLAVIDGDGHGADETIASVALGMRTAGQVGLAQGADGRHYVLRATEVHLNLKSWDEMMAIRVKNLVASETRERVLRTLAEQLLEKTPVSVDESALKQLRVPSMSEYP